MGYTHYWTVRRDFTQEEWATLRSYVEPLIRGSNVPVAGPMGTGEPVIDSELISLNGLEAGDQFHEALHIPRQVCDYDDFNREVGKKKKLGAWAFCKTAYKPYDQVVIRILAAAQQVADNLDPASDGGVEVFSSLGKLIP